MVRWLLMAYASGWEKHAIKGWMQFLVLDIQMTSALIQTATLTIAIMLVRMTMITPVMQISIEVMVVGQPGAERSKRFRSKMGF